MSASTPTFLGREPVLWTSALRAVLPLLVLFGVPLTPEQMAGIFLAAEAILAIVVRQSVTANANVVELADRAGQVYAGPANELPSGSEIRLLDEAA